MYVSFKKHLSVLCWALRALWGGSATEHLIGVCGIWAVRVGAVVVTLTGMAHETRHSETPTKGNLVLAPFTKLSSTDS